MTALSQRQYRDAIDPRLPASGKKGARANLRYNAAAVVAALVEYRVEQAQVDEDGALLVGKTSPAMERLRRLKGDLAEIEVAERRSHLIPREELEGELAVLAGVLRKANSLLAQRFGNDAGSILNDAIDECVAGWDTVATLHSPDREFIAVDVQSDSHAEA